MKPLGTILITLGVFVFFQVNGQDKVNYPDSSGQELNLLQTGKIMIPDTTKKVIVNMEMIRRFREYKPDTNFLTFREILKNYDFKAIQEAYEAYYHFYFQKSLKEENTEAK